jgi:glycosyltransferase involved in cell wall biosynthesis
MIATRQVSVITAATSHENLEEVIRRLKNQTKKPYEILVVDNSQNENESEKIKKVAKNLGARYIREEREGLHNARNRGVIEAEGEIIQFIDDDALAERNLIEEISKQYKSEDIAAVGGKVVPIFKAKLPKFFKYLKYQYLSVLDYGNEIKEVDYLIGNNMSFRKDIYIKVGGVNPDAYQSSDKLFFRGDGESGLCRKIKKLGKKIIYTPYAVVYHVIPERRLSIEYLRKKAFGHGAQMSYSKFFGGKFPPNHILFLRSNAFFLLFILNKILGKIIPHDMKVRYDVWGETMKARWLYELKLIFDKNLREHVSKTNWIDEIRK